MPLAMLQTVDAAFPPIAAAIQGRLLYCSARALTWPLFHICSSL